MDADGDPERGNPRGAGGLPDETHACLRRGEPPFSAVAFNAAGNDIAPLSFPSPGPGKDMVIGELFRNKFPAAVLTAVLIPGIDVLSGEFDRGLRSFHYSQEAYNRRELDRKTDRMDLPAVFFKHLDLAKEKERNRLFPIDNLQGSYVIFNIRTFSMGARSCCKGYQV